VPISHSNNIDRRDRVSGGRSASLPTAAAREMPVTDTASTRFNRMKTES
jgi:hypothetical protein